MSDDDELLARAWEILQRRANATAAPSVTVREIYEKYELHASRALADSWDTYEDRLLPFVAALGDREVASLRALDWTDYRAAREREEYAPGRTRKASTLNLELGCIKAMFHWAMAEGRIPHNPFAAAKRVKTRRHRETAPRHEELDRLIAESSGPQLVVVLCAVDSGMRCSEIASLSWDWIDRQAMSIALPNWACKGKRGGVIPMTARLLEAIEAMPRKLRSPWVLASNRGPDGRYNRRTLSRWWRAAADAAGLQAAPGDDKVHLHDGRHSAASCAVAAGVPIEVVSRSLLRHSSIAQTLDYLQLPPPDLNMARALIEDGIKGARRGPHRAADSAMDESEKSKGGQK